MHYIYLTIAFCLNATANIILKISANSFQGKPFFTAVSRETLLSFIKERSLFIFGIFLFALNVFFYYASLRTVQVSVAYPVMVAMSVLIINGYAIFFLNESIRAIQVAGYVAIIIGVMCVFFGAK